MTPDRDSPEVALAESVSLDPTVADSPPRRVLGRQLGRFAVIGVGSTLLNLVLFAGFRQVFDNQVANIAALLICTILNTAANRRFTFEADRTNALAVQVRSMVLLLITWGASAAALWALHRVSPGAGTLAATLTVAAGNALATALRFVLLRRWFAT
ncbi:GtrA family protein [Calidifontibacter terrae]